MNKNLMIVSAIILIALVGGSLVMSQRQTSSTPAESTMEKKGDAMVEKTSDSMEKKEESMIKTEDTLKNDDAMKAKAGIYVTYSKAEFDKAAGAENKLIYFFHATWCPECKAANQEFTQKASELPVGVTIFKTDYDTEKELKTKYAVTTQHTFVQVDKTGKELTKWNGGGLDLLIKNLK